MLQALPQLGQYRVSVLKADPLIDEVLKILIRNYPIPERAYGRKYGYP
jgi:hypothetical protein